MAEAPTRLEDDQGRERLVRRNPAVLWRRSVGCVVALCPEKGEIITLESPGDAVWRLLDRPRTLDEISSAMLAIFIADEDEVRRDVDDFLSSLLDAGLALYQDRAEA